MSTDVVAAGQGTIVVCGGGCYGGYYVRQLARARAAGALGFERLLVVDRDPECRVARLADAIGRDDAAGMAHHGWRLRTAGAAVEPPGDEPAYRGLPISFLAQEWAPFFDQWFAAAIATPTAVEHDAVVPSPLMPNLLADWVGTRLVAHRPGAGIERMVTAGMPSTPWSRTGADGSHYASFATWMCPINCIEPPRCPETRSARDWTMPSVVRQAADAAAARGEPYQVVALFHTAHRAYGVGMFDVAAALAADMAIAAAAADPEVRVLVASVSHCHGAMAELHSRL